MRRRAVGIALAAAMAGLAGCAEGGRASPRPVTLVGIDDASWGSVAEASPRTSEVDAELLEELQALGYLD